MGENVYAFAQGVSLIDGFLILGAVVFLLITGAIAAQLSGILAQLRRMNATLLDVQVGIRNSGRQLDASLRELEAAVSETGPTRSAVTLLSLLNRDREDLHGVVRTGLETLRDDWDEAEEVLADMQQFLERDRVLHREEA